MTKKTLLRVIIARRRPLCRGSLRSKMARLAGPARSPFLRRASRDANHPGPARESVSPSSQENQSPPTIPLGGAACQKPAWAALPQSAVARVEEISVPKCPGVPRKRHSSRSSLWSERTQARELSTHVAFSWGWRIAKPKAIKSTSGRRTLASSELPLSPRTGKLAGAPPG